MHVSHFHFLIFTFSLFSLLFRISLFFLGINISLLFLGRYFKEDTNLVKVRDVVCTFVWSHLSEGYSQGMCDLLTPLLVIMSDEALVYACYLKIMETAIKLFPPNTTMNTRLANVQVLLQVSVCVYV